MGWYTGVGSRETPEDVQLLQKRMGAMFFEKGWILRSGGAGGSDESYQFGVMGARGIEGVGGFEIYIPWNGFNGLWSKMDTGFLIATQLKMYFRAQEIAQELHPTWPNCSESAKKLHTRNIFQVLGSDLESPSRFLTCWAKPKGKSEEVEGGTNTAVKLAIQHRIPIFNLYHDDVRERAEKAVYEHRLAQGFI